MVSLAKEIVDDGFMLIFEAARLRRGDGISAPFSAVS